MAKSIVVRRLIVVDAFFVAAGLAIAVLLITDDLTETGGFGRFEADNGIISSIGLAVSKLRDSVDGANSFRFLCTVG